MTQLNIFIELTRLNRPIGFMLLFWPCAWGLAYSYSSNHNLKEFSYYLLLFFLGSILMRSAGCIVNDIVDKDIDAKVERTKKRPLASGSISINQSLFYILVLCSLAFIILVQFNNLTIFLGLASMPLAFSYPLMKRITYWPQLFLGLTFNWGIIMASAAINNVVSFEIILLYFSAIFWTLGYDTIYGVQDLKDDEIIGIKSTSIKFKKNLKKFITTCYLICSSILFYIFLLPQKINFSLVILILFIITLLLQIKMTKKNNPKKCLQAFRLNNLSGLILFLGIFFNNI
ncbi:MAG: 4-hydroxybenzoate octaprenyltransferase [Pelagibacteraceae bacterium]